MENPFLLKVHIYVCIYIYIYIYIYSLHFHFSLIHQYISSQNIWSVWCSFTTFHIFKNHNLQQYFSCLLEKACKPTPGYLPHKEREMSETLRTKLCEWLWLSVIFFFFMCDTSVTEYGFLLKHQSQKIKWFNFSKLCGTFLLHTNLKSHLKIHLKDLYHPNTYFI